MSALTIPNSFTTGTTINSAPFNQNFSAIQTWSANIDNTNIGAAGLFASQVIPTSSLTATFGGSNLYTFPAGVAAGGPLTATTGAFSAALSTAGLLSSTQGGNWLQATNGLTNAIWLTQQNTGGNLYLGIESSTGASIFSGSSVYAGVLGVSGSRAFQIATSNTVVQTISAGGQTSFTGAVVAGSATAGTVTAGDVWASRGVSSGALALGGSSTSGLFDFGVTTAGAFSANAAFNATGNIATSAGRVLGTSNGSTQTYYPPVYTNAGAATANTLHIVTGTTTITFTSSTQSATSTVNLTGAAQFANNTSYIVLGNVEGTGQLIAIAVNNGVGSPSTSFGLVGEAPSAISGTFTATYLAIGT